MKKLLLSSILTLSFLWSFAQQQFDYQAHSTTGSDTYTVSITNVTAYSAGTPERGIGFSIIFDTSSSGSCTLNVNGLGAITINGDITADVVYRLEYNVVTDEFDMISGGSGGITGTGTANQIAVWDGTSSQTGYSNFTWDNTNKRFIVGNGTSSGSNSINFGDDTDLYGSWAFTTAESSTIRGNNNISAGWLHEIGDGVTFGSGASTFTFGVENVNNGNSSYVGGIGGKVEPTVGRNGGFVHAFSVGDIDGTKPDDVEFVLATDGAFNIGRNTSAQTSGRGAMAVDGGILGGVDNHIPDTSPRSVIIGGEGIEARASDPDNVYVPYLNVTEIDQDDTLSQIVARNMTTKKLYWRDASTFGGGVTPAELSVTDDTNYDLSLSGSPSDALLQDVGLSISHSGVFAVSRGGTGTGTQFTPGSLIFAGTSGVYTQDNSNFYIDDTNNRLGLGITTPLAKIHFAAQSTTANSAPLAFTSGSLETTARANILEWSTAPYITNNATVRAGVGGVIYQSFADVNNSGTSATDMDTKTLRASTFANNGEMVRYEFGGTTNDATATYQFIVSIGGTNIFDSGAITVSSTGSYKCSCLLVRTSTSNVRATCDLSVTSSSVAIPPFVSTVTGLTLGNTNILKYTVTAGGASGGSSDATHKMSSMFWFPLADD